jgi:hypothetical protein
MAGVYDSNDFAWTLRGDYVISHDGDLMDTYEDPLRSVVEEIRDCVKSDKGDWKLYPEVGASISDYVGEPNTKLSAEAIKMRILTAITRNGLVNSNDVKILYAPIDIDKIMFRLSLTVAPTARNRASQYLTLNVIYSYSENNVYAAV